MESVVAVVLIFAMCTACMRALREAARHQRETLCDREDEFLIGRRVP